MEEFSLGGVLVRTISITKEDWKWVQERGYSLTRILRKAISDLKNRKDFESLKDAEAKMKRWQDIAQQQQKFLESRGLTGEYMQDQQKKEDNELKRKKEAEEILKEGLEGK